MHILRSLSVAALAAALPIGLGAGVANADTASTGQDRLVVDTDTNLTDLDDILVDIRVASFDDDGDAFGVRSRTASSDVNGLENVRTDNRTVSSDQDGDGTAARAIVAFDDLSGVDGIDSDVDLVTIDGNGDGAGRPGAVAGQQDGSSQDEQQYRDDAQFVLDR